jgi:hypothetical protein
VFAFLVILPTGEHFHIATALPTLFFRRGGPVNAVPPVDLDKLMSDDADAASVRVGIRTAPTWSGRTGWTPSPAPSAAAARTPARPS